MSNPLNDLVDAEDFLNFFQVPFNSKIVKVVRLHLLKQFRTYLEKEQLLESNPNDSDVWEKQRKLLIQAYQDFVNTEPSWPNTVSAFQQANQKKTSSACSSCSTGCTL